MTPDDEDVERLVNACDLAGSAIPDDVARAVLEGILKRHDPSCGTLCFSCGNDVAVGVAGPVNATPFRGSPAFGSDFDGDGELELVVCDSCLGERSERVARLVTTQVTRTRREAWGGSR